MHKEVLRVSTMTCDICGGELAMARDGIFAVCESCGMKHTKERIKEKMQEPAVVTKPVVEDNGEKKRLMSNAETFLKLNEKEKAAELFQKMADYYPDDYRGWLGLARDKYESLKHLLSEEIDENTAKRMLELLAAGHTFCKKAGILNEKVADEERKLEADFLKAYETCDLPFLNLFTIEVITDYVAVRRCSPAIRQWAEDVVDQYIEQFKTGETNELYWKLANPYEHVKLYPAAVEFLQAGYENAQCYCACSDHDKRVLLRALGAQLPGFYYTCVFWYANTMLFSRERAGSERFVTVKTEAHFDGLNASQLIEDKLKEQEEKCDEIRMLLTEVQEHSEIVDKLLEIFTEERIKKDSHREVGFTYEITSVSAFCIEYKEIYYKVEKYRRTRERRSRKGCIYLKSIEELNTVVEATRSYRGRCPRCGSRYKGIMKHVCPSCGHTKD